jgi:glycosyltransferase involved in cell wall biosynthesis
MISIDEARRSTYKYVPTKDKIYQHDQLIITVIIDCYYNLNLIKKSVSSVLKQDYCNVELLLVNNGSDSKVSEYIQLIYEQQNNVAIIEFKENQFSWDDIQKTVVICWNAGVLHAEGSVICHLNYDDMLSSNCCSKMAKLFIDNSNCVTAGPLPISIDVDGEESEEFNKRVRENNSRDRYVNGKDLALDFINNNQKKYFSTPGGVLFIRKDIIIKAGGFDRSSDITQIIKFSIFGDCGFDPDAKLYWRHHDGQLNKIAKNKGITWCNLLVKVVKSDNVVQSWKKIFKKEEVDLLKKYIYAYSRDATIDIAIGHIRRKNITAFLKYILSTLLKCPRNGLISIFYSFIEVIKMVDQKLTRK